MITHACWDQGYQPKQHQQRNQVRWNIWWGNFGQQPPNLYFDSCHKDTFSSSLTYSLEKNTLNVNTGSLLYATISFSVEFNYLFLFNVIVAAYSIFITA